VNAGTGERCSPGRRFTLSGTECVASFREDVPHRFPLSVITWEVYRPREQGSTVYYAVGLFECSGEQRRAAESNGGSEGGSSIDCE